MNNPADICRECELPHGYACSDCELPQKVQQLEHMLSEMAIEVVALTEENRVLRLRVKEEAE